MKNRNHKDFALSVQTFLDEIRSDMNRDLELYSCYKKDNNIKDDWDGYGVNENYIKFRQSMNYKSYLTSYHRDNKLNKLLD